MGFCADRLERSFELPHIAFRIRKERDVDVDVGGAEVSRRFSTFAAGEKLGDQPAEHDQVELVGAQCAEELKECILDELARFG